jgi:muconolactone delta-isomerase
VLFIASGTDLRPDLFGPFLAEEAATVQQLRAEGTVKAVFKRASGGGVITIVEAASPEEAAEQLGRLPLVREGLLAFELTEVIEL